MIEGGEVRIAGAQTEPRHRLSAGDRIEWRAREPEAAAPASEAIPLDILYEDRDLIVVNKPAGLVVHPGAGNPAGTLVNALLHHCGESLSGIGGVRRPGIVHRLDKDTSGVLVVAKNDLTHQALSSVFADHGRSGSLERKYLALVWGRPERAAGTIRTPIGRSVADRTKRAVVAEGRPDARTAVTHFRICESFGGESGVASLVECRLETGRTHQIRVHMAHIGHPLIGDRTYGQGFASKARTLPEPLRTIVEAFPRQALHAASLGFDHPSTGHSVRFEARLPADMALLIESFRQYEQEAQMKGAQARRT